MKPKNFPERKRQRQLGAKQRLEANGNKYLNECSIALRHESKVNVEKELLSLSKIPSDPQTHVKTKKNRS